MDKNKLSVVCANHFDNLYKPGNAFSNTPTLQYSFGLNPEPALGQTKAVHSELGFFTYSYYASLRAIRRSSHWTPKESIIHMTRYMAVTVSHISMVT